MVDIVGPARTKQIVVLSEEMIAGQAFDWVLVQEVTEDGVALAAAIAVAKKVNVMPPIAVKMTKRAVNAVANALNHAANYRDTDQSIRC